MKKVFNLLLVFTLVLILSAWTYDEVDETEIDGVKLLETKEIDGLDWDNYEDDGSDIDAWETGDVTIKAYENGYINIKVTPYDAEEQPTTGNHHDLTIDINGESYTDEENTGGFDDYKSKVVQAPFDEEIEIDIDLGGYEWSSEVTTTLDAIPEPIPIHEAILDNLEGIGKGTIDIFETAFSDDGIARIFYDFEADDGEGEMTVIGILSLIGVGFVITRYGFKYVVRLLRFRG